MQRLIIIGLLVVAAMFGACTDVPIDDGSSTVITKTKEPTLARTLRLDSGSVYIYYAERFPTRVDTLEQNIEISLVSHAVMTLDTEQGKENLGFEFTTPIPWPINTPQSLTGVQALWINVPHIALDLQPGARINLNDNPRQWDHDGRRKTGAGVYYPVPGTNDYDDPCTTGQGGSLGTLTITKIDQPGRTIEGKIDLKISFTGQGPVSPAAPHERLRMFEIKGVTIRLTY